MKKLRFDAKTISQEVAKSGLTVAELARKIGIAPYTLRRAICGENLSPTTYARLIRYFDFDPQFV